jgi:hypothetical protein
MVAGAGTVAGEGPDAIMRIDPSEELHLLPAIPPRLARAALLDHVRDWPGWVEDMTTIGAQSYSVLSLCRAWCAVVEGEQLSKRGAADRFAAARPAETELVRWARDWWYAAGSDDEPGRHAEVRDFVNERAGTCWSWPLTAPAGSEGRT